MTTDNAIHKAVDGGWKPPPEQLTKAMLDSIDDILKWCPNYLLDPSFWQSLGKALSWKENRDRKHPEMVKAEYCDCRNCEYWAGNPVWKYQWHRLIDHRAEGGSVESFFKTLI